ncbi:ATP-dependent helicase rhp16-like [Solanum dulcamara]|uniref:ATP-dependent helicase rhp16-like n=1 Tax=Solanum dulcamara TaxID=45834 RepID=UPI002484D9E0|nr:ATP-dependent helicase rhp16-like [Solanum dulcamara]
MVLLKHTILKTIMLRRTKKGRAADLALPPRIVTLRKDSFDVKEEDYYTSLVDKTRAKIFAYIQAGILMNNYAHIFYLLTRMRKAVNHPYLVEYSSTTLDRSGSTNNVGYVEQPYGLCHNPVEDPVVTSCIHVFCKLYLIDFSATVEQLSCPSCSKLITVDFTANDQKTRATIKGFKSSSILNRIHLDNFRTSTKIEALREEIRFMIERDDSTKAIVFSQFTSFLDLIHYSLQKSGISCVQLDGSMTMSARDSAITRFTNDPDCIIFLMSLKAGGLSLNLTVASQVFLMDPWWNDAVERQAQDRVHRIGQYKPIRIVRFVIENTIEERILELQEKKKLLFDGTIGGASEALGKLTEAELKFFWWCQQVPSLLEKLGRDKGEARVRAYHMVLKLERGLRLLDHHQVPVVHSTVGQPPVGHRDNSDPLSGDGAQSAPLLVLSDKDKRRYVKIILIQNIGIRLKLRFRSYSGLKLRYYRLLGIHSRNHFQLFEYHRTNMHQRELDHWFRECPYCKPALPAPQAARPAPVAAPPVTGRG